MTIFNSKLLVYQRVGLGLKQLCVPRFVICGNKMWFIIPVDHSPNDFEQNCPRVNKHNLLEHAVVQWLCIYCTYLHIYIYIICIYISLYIRAHITTVYYIILYHIILYCIILYDIILHYVILYHIILYYSIVYDIILYHIILYYILYYIILSYLYT